VTCAIRAGRGGGIDLGSVLKLVLAIDNDDLSGFQSGAHTDAVAGGLRDGEQREIFAVLSLPAA